VGYELLIDEEARKAFDTLLGAKLRAEQKKQAMSNKRKKMQDDLERRELAAQSKTELDRAEALLKQHLDRIRMENLERMKTKQVPVGLEEREEEEAEPELKKRMVTPYSQKFASLEMFELFCLAKMNST
jgi:aryl carrier-like protein